jgi:hypothetical protein
MTDVTKSDRRLSASFAKGAGRAGAGSTTRILPADYGPCIE